VQALFTICCLRYCSTAGLAENDSCQKAMLSMGIICFLHGNGAEEAKTNIKATRKCKAFSVQKIII